MYGDGVDPVEDELIDKTMAVHNLRVAAKRDADAMAVLTAAVSERDRLLLAAQAESAELRGKLALALSLIAELRGYTADWDWKYGEDWDKQRAEIEKGE